MTGNSDSEIDSTMAASKAFDKILDCVKTSNLNFCLQLSPFSANISLKKSLIKNKAGFYLNPPVDTDLSLLKEEKNVLAKKVIDLENIVADLKFRLEESQTECEQAHDIIQKLENELNIKQEVKKSKSANEKALNNWLEEQTLEINILKEEKLQFENQIVDLQTRLQSSQSAVKKLNKEVNENRINHEKNIRLTVNDLKSELKSWKKSFGLERSRKIKVERKLAILENKLSKPKHPVSCQTNHNLDIPYLVTDALPPIFGSKLCHKSKAINFMSLSLPNLSTVSWVNLTEEDILEDAAEQAMNDQYDYQVEQFYIDAKKKAEDIAQVFEENYIEKLFVD